ncbi:hypothetical protein HMSSN036_61860 [Paenibacillus macerans]|nr:hypothetical protein HMSSN036_61860 [Paenibacillus macerans]
MNICGYYPESINEGEGLRAAIFISGCRHYCKGCFSPETWNFNYGEPFTPEREAEIIHDIKITPAERLDDPRRRSLLLRGRSERVIDRLVAETGPISIWIYSGYTYEELTEHPGSPNMSCCGAARCWWTGVSSKSFATLPCSIAAVRTNG